jgi:hypothetical protein
MVVLAMAGLLLVSAGLISAAPSEGQIPPTGQLISQASILAGLAPGALFPFVDSTPNHIVLSHVAITDSTSTCAPGAAPPANIQVLAGVAGADLAKVMTAATNTGIGSPSQCVFHVTIRPGKGGVPSSVTDIVVLNANTSNALTGINTVTASAEVRQARGTD